MTLAFEQELDPVSSLSALFSSPATVSVLKLRLQWASDVVQRKQNMHTNFLWVSLLETCERRDGIILDKWVLRM
jgi:hypothetical protein